MVARCISLEGGASPIGLARLLSLKPQSPRLGLFICPTILRTGYYAIAA